MILLIGPLHGGKRDYACALLGCGRDELGRYACWDVQERAAGCENLEALAREPAGQLLCLLARRADRVVRVFYGLPLTLKENGAEDV